MGIHWQLPWTPVSLKPKSSTKRRKVRVVWSSFLAQFRARRVRVLTCG